ncbi:MAG TPA: hypothetical protein DHU88_02755, partial [Pseudomonas sp.]|nr:hypothetical protein [Pseudomonas sp.]
MAGARSLKCAQQDVLVLVEHAFGVQQRQHALARLAGQPRPQVGVEVQPDPGAGQRGGLGRVASPAV